MISLKAATEWNAKGVNSMLSGDYSAALLSFRQALDMAQAVSPVATTSQVQFHNFRLQEEQCLSIDTQASCTVFDLCFNVVMKETFWGYPSKYEIDFVIAIVLYNIALSCHQQGICRGTQKGYCEKALRIYSMSASLLQTLGATRDNFSVLLGIANNMACLSLEKFDFQKFQCYREWMGYLIISNKKFHTVFFSSNFASTHNVQDRPAPAA